MNEFREKEWNNCNWFTDVQQERLIKKLGEGAVPFRLTVPAGAPGSVTLQPGLEDEGEPCGVQYYVKVFVGDSEIDRSHRRYAFH